MFAKSTLHRHGIAATLTALALCLAAIAPVARAQAQPAPDRQRWQQFTPAERDSLRAERKSNRERSGEKSGQPDRQSMSRDERQQLRRDIGDHGREVYGGRSGGGHPAFAPNRPPQR